MSAILLQLNSAFGQVPALNLKEGIEIQPEFIIASGVVSADSNTTNPGMFAIGFDGTNYLVVSCREIGSPPGIFGVIISGSGAVLKTFHISQVRCSNFPFPAVAFDGTNYLVVFVRDGQIFGTRVSPSGEVLDSPSGFAISSGIPFVTTNFSPAVAFDGVNYLVVWNKFIDNSHDIFGAKVTPDGQVLDEIPIFRAPGGQVFPSLAFDGVNYLVVWSDTRSGSPIGPDADIFGTRVSPEGTVLDPEGIPISTAPGAQGVPHVIFDGTNYFVVWPDTRNGPNDFPPRQDIFGARIKPDGTLLDGPSDTGGIAINTAPFPKGWPRVGFDGTHYFVTWEVSFFFNPPVGIFAARVSTDGLLIDGPPDTEGILISEPTCFACRLVFPNILFNGESFLIAWVNNTEVFGTTKDIIGVLIFPSVSFNALEPKVNLFTSTPGRDRFFAKGSFVLNTESDGIDPITEVVVFSLADTDGTFFSQTLPPGSFQRIARKGFSFHAPHKSSGIRLMTIRTTRSEGQFNFRLRGRKLDLREVNNSPVTVSLRIGNDNGSKTIPCLILQMGLRCR